ncbi:MAG: hypothetical protein WC831_03455 [Parcubacteria group bacterium]
MNQKTKKNLTHWLSVIVIGIALGFAIQFVKAWTEPSATPPNGNLGAPINTGAQNQTKSGGITASTLSATTVTGTTQLCIGTDCRTSWPSGSSTTTTATTTTPPAPTIYQCPDDFCARSCGGSCLGQVSSSSTCGSYWCSYDGVCGGGGVGEAPPTRSCTPI